MATIADALRLKLLHEFALPDTEARTPLRPLYVAGELFDWVDDNRSLHDLAHGKGGRTRFEALVQAFSDFRCDKRPLVGDLNRLQPTRAGVWSMHTPGLRVFGWVPAPNRFVAIVAADIEVCHGPNSVVADRRRVVLDFANRHGLSNTIQLGDKLALFPPSAG